MAYLDDLQASREAILARLIALAPSAGINYELDGEKYDTEIKELIDALKEMDDLILAVETRSPSVKRMRVVRGWVP